MLKLMNIDYYSPKKWSSTGSEAQSSGTAEMLLSEIAVLKSKTTEMEKECKWIRK